MSRLFRARLYAATLILAGCVVAPVEASAQTSDAAWAAQFDPMPKVPGKPPTTVSYDQLISAVNTAIKAADTAKSSADRANGMAGPKKKPSELSGPTNHAGAQMEQVPKFYTYVAQLLRVYANQLVPPPGDTPNGELTEQDVALLVLRQQVFDAAAEWDAQAAGFTAVAKIWMDQSIALGNSDKKGTLAGGGGGGSPGPAAAAAAAAIGIGVLIAADQIGSPPKPVSP